MIRMLAVTACLVSTLTLAQNVPGSISFNGRLTNTAGMPVTGNQAMGFGIYDQPTGGAALWSENVGAASFDADGLTYVELGAVTPLTTSVFDGRRLYLEISVAGTTMTPRLAIVSVPYAIRASIAATANTANTAQTANMANTANTANTANMIGTLTANDIQRRVTGTCSTGSVTGVNADGTVTCTSGATATPLSCRAIKMANATAANGIYDIDPDGAGPKPAVQTFCDMTTDGGGWSLVGHSITAAVGVSDDNRGMPSLRCGGGKWRPWDRISAGAIDATDLVKISTEIAFSMSTTGGLVPNGPIGTYAYGYKFTIPDPSKVHFKNHATYGPNNNTTDNGNGPCTAVTVTGIQGTTFSGTRYTLRNVLGLSWADTYPSGYGAGSTANCLGFDGGPFFPSIHSGHGHATKNGVPLAECDVSGSPSYAYRGTYTDSTVNNTGSNAIWLR